VSTPKKVFPLVNRSPLWLTVAQTVHLEPGSDSGRSPAVIIGYLYRIGFGVEGSQELLAYHFDPHNEQSGSQEPHLHVGRSAYRPLSTAPVQNFHKRHIPTGHVTFPMVVRFLIEELGVDPINPNWERVLAETTPE
jgi:hypothetical protein